MQYTEIAFGSKNKNFHWNKIDIFLIFAQNIDCGYTLEPPRRGGSNEYLQPMFWSKNRYTPAYPSFTIQKWGLMGYSLHGHVFLMAFLCQMLHDCTSIMKESWIFSSGVKARRKLYPGTNTIKSIIYYNKAYNRKI